MSDPTRIMDEADGAAARMLRSALGDAPDAGSRERALAALGLAGVAAAGTVASLEGTGAAASASKGVSLAILKIAGVVVAGGAITTAVIASLAPARDPAPMIQAQPAPVRAVAASAPPATERAPEPAAEAPPAAAPAAASPPARRPALASEIALIDEARQALSAGDGKRALRALDRRDHRFPRGPMAPEAAVLRVEALIQNGNGAEAAKLGEAFLAANPGSPHARHLRLLLSRRAGP